MDTGYTTMDNSKVILCCDLIDGNDVMKSPHPCIVSLHQKLVLQTFFCDRIYIARRAFLIVGVSLRVCGPTHLCRCVIV